MGASGCAEKAPTVQDTSAPDAETPDVEARPVPLTLTVVTFNSGTTEGLAHDGEPDDGYTSAHAALSDQYYGDGLAWVPAVQAATAFFAQVQPDIVVFQEIFYSGDCAEIPAEARADFVCESYTSGQPTVAQVLLGDGYQVACHIGKTDKCAAVRTAFGTFAGCNESLCLDGLDGAKVDGCGGGSRVGRGTIELATGGTLTVVNVHGSSGFKEEDIDCRKRQFEQVFVDLDGQPAANGVRNLVMGDLNTDPARALGADASADRLADFAGGGKAFHFITAVGLDAPATYAGFFNIDHVLSDSLVGDCWAAGNEPHPAVIDAVYFDHQPIVCTVTEPNE